jgi:hypothetical protein
MGPQMIPAAEAIRLDYRGGPDPVAPAWSTRPLRLVRLCWASPLAVGLLTATIAAFSVLAGYGTPEICVQLAAADVVIDLLFSGVGYIAILTFVAMRWSPTAGDRWRGLFRPAASAVALLLSNYLIAFGFVWASVANR